MKTLLLALLLLPNLLNVASAGTPDLNKDGFVNALDIGILKEFYGQTGTEADVNLDGIVNAIDIGIFKEYFGLPAPEWKLTWIAPSQREDGSGISLSEIAGYKIYCGVESGVYNEPVQVIGTQYILMTTRYCVVTTVDTDGRESTYSEEVKL